MSRSACTLLAMGFDGDLVQTIDARGLGTALLVGANFEDWIKHRI